MGDFEIIKINFEKIKIPKEISTQIKDSCKDLGELIATAKVHNYLPFQGNVGIDHIDLNNNSISFVKKQSNDLEIGVSYISFTVEIKSKDRTWSFHPLSSRMKGEVVDCKSNIEDWKGRENVIGFQDGLFYIEFHYEE